MISVLPATVSHPTEMAATKTERLSPKPVTTTIRHGAHSLRA
jgi:hypothetical protein